MQSPLVLITRPEADAAALAEKLRSRGYGTLCIPMMHITHPENAASAIESALDGLIQGIIVTSRNALLPLSRLECIQGIPLFVVGPETETAAREMGFSHIYLPESTARGGAYELVEYIRQRCQPESGIFIYLSGDTVQADIPSLLAESGLQCKRVTVYRALPSSHLSQECLAALSQHCIAYALFYSARTAEIFTELLTQAGLRDACNSIVAIAISENVALALHALPFRAIHASRTPVTDEMLEFLPEIRHDSDVLQKVKA